MSSTRKSYPSDVTDEEWEYLLPYLTLMREDAPQREYALRELFNALRYVVKTGCQWRFLPHDFPPWTAVYQQARRWNDARAFEAAAHDLRQLIRLATKHGSKVHAAVDSLGNLLALVATPANEQERAQVAALSREVQEACQRSVQVAFVDQGYTGQDAAQAAQEQGIRLEVVKHAEAKRGFVLLPRRWVVERTFAWLGRFRRLARDYERLDETLKAWHWVAAIALGLHSYFSSA
jgi:transposase